MLDNSKNSNWLETKLILIDFDWFYHFFCWRQNRTKFVGYNNHGSIYTFCSIFFNLLLFLNISPIINMIKLTFFVNVSCFSWASIEFILFLTARQTFFSSYRTFSFYFILRTLNSFLVCSLYFRAGLRWLGLRFWFWVWRDPERRACCTVSPAAAWIRTRSRRKDSTPSPSAKTTCTSSFWKVRLHRSHKREVQVKMIIQAVEASLKVACQLEVIKTCGRTGRGTCPKPCSWCSWSTPPTLSCFRWRRSI